jgi:hypothetical protein
MLLFSRLWASRLLSKPRRLRAVKFLEAKPTASTLLSAPANLLRLQAQFAWRVIFYGGFLERWDTCILMVVAWAPIWTNDITGYVFLALRATSSFCYTQSYLSHLAGVVKKWTLGAWATSSCRNRWFLILTDLAFSCENCCNSVHNL